MSTPKRILFVSEPADDADARAFIARFAAALPGATVDHFAPAFSFASVPAWLVQESRARVASAEVILCLVGKTLLTSAWATWAISAGLDAEKRVMCLRLHANASRDVPPPIAAARRVAIMDAEAAAVVAYLVHGRLPPERPATVEPELEAPLLHRFGQRS